jgi:hypothetical protein
MPFQDVVSMLLPPSNPFPQQSMVFGLPGQPSYRLLLGQYLAPPRVKFRNFSHNTRRPPLLRINGVRPEVETYETDTDNFVARIQHFRDAESTT